MMPDLTRTGPCGMHVQRPMLKQQRPLDARPQGREGPSLTVLARGMGGDRVDGPLADGHGAIEEQDGSQTLDLDRGQAEARPPDVEVQLLGHGGGRLCDEAGVKEQLSRARRLEHTRTNERRPRLDGAHPVYTGPGRRRQGSTVPWLS